MKIVEVNLVHANSGKVKARADVHFEGFLLKGFKVIVDDNNKEYVTPPSYLAGGFWRPLFRTDHTEDWQNIQRVILKKYNEELIKESIGGNDDK